MYIYFLILITSQLLYLFYYYHILIIIYRYIYLIHNINIIINDSKIKSATSKKKKKRFKPYTGVLKNDSLNSITTPLDKVTTTLLLIPMFSEVKILHNYISYICLSTNLMTSISTY